jgi:cytochrome c oxidase assembly protein subunit 15
MGFTRMWARFTYVLSVITLVGLFIVNLVGFIDTETGSAFGCGHQWPLCNGQIIPDKWGLHTIIEFLHRGLVAVVTVLLLIACIGALSLYRRRRDLMWSVVIAIGCVAIEAFLGAMGVLFADPPIVLAFHFGISLLAFNGMLLVAVLVGQLNRRARLGQESLPLRTTPPDPRLKWWTWVAIAYTYVAMYVGAYVSASGDGKFFRGWPFPTETYAQAGSALIIDWIHRTIALGIIVISMRLYFLARRYKAERPDIYRGATVGMIFIFMQAFSGIWLVIDHTSVDAFMLHVSIITLYFASLFYVALQLLPEPLTREARRALRAEQARAR